MIVVTSCRSVQPEPAASSGRRNGAPDHVAPSIGKEPEDATGFWGERCKPTVRTLMGEPRVVGALAFESARDTLQNALSRVDTCMAFITRLPVTLQVRASGEVRRVDVGGRDADTCTYPLSGGARQCPGHCLDRVFRSVHFVRASASSTVDVEVTHDFTNRSDCTPRSR